MERWQDATPKEILDKMIQKKIDTMYEQDNRPTHEDTFAKVILDISERSVCLFHQVAAIIYKDNNQLSTGYNGPTAGDVHCTKVGCARVIGGELKKGTGDCRGTHAELNAIGNAAKCGICIAGASIMITWAPCFTCAKQIVNSGIKHVLYLLDYEDRKAKLCLHKAKITFSEYEPRLESLKKRIELLAKINGK